MIESPRVKTTRYIVVYTILTLGAIVMLVPLLWTVSTSLKTRDKVTIRRLELIPDPITFENYPNLFEIRPMVKYTRNTMIIVVASLFGAWVPCTLGWLRVRAHSFPREELPLRHLAGDNDAALCGEINSAVSVFR